MGKLFLRHGRKGKQDDEDQYLNRAAPEVVEEENIMVAEKQKQDKSNKLMKKNKTNAWQEEDTKNDKPPDTRSSQRTNLTTAEGRAKVPASVIKARKKAEAEAKRQMEEEEARRQEEEERKMKEMENKPIIYDACVRCMEDGTGRICCGTIYCDYCYTIETKCPTCNTASVVDETQFKGKFAREGE
eukprot:CAMPEP_0117735428 /NCGR_PEP_ID=MMETSP0947-20121206/1294_1 /TAXON_ID=44440 /ORGANISM="Chattonella subsalsa, Strain CCMP2191" /LENGTH=185 /DNA_ID=CAMNT_0005550457 /DNA_START=21 /DNA_END=575 /DNA_ORIENTATION=+